MAVEGVSFRRSRWFRRFPGWTHGMGAEIALSFIHVTVSK
jgi:hypothetical protein